jgi:hypothetical protein
MGVKRLLLTLGLAGCAACSGALAGGRPNDPLHREQPVPVAASTTAYDGHVTDVGAWLDSSRATAPFTTFVTYWLSCDEEATSVEPQIDPRDARRILWFPAVFDYGPTSRSLNGYTLRPDAEACLQRLAPLVAKYRARTYGVHLADEPESVAWNDHAPNDPPNVNQYNADLAAASTLVHRVWGPDLKVSINVGAVPAELAIAEGLDRIALEAYGVDWLANLRNLERLTALPLLLMPPAFARGDPTTQDAIVAQRIRDEFAYAKTDPRVVGLYWFLWCCDDRTTGTRDFYAAGGASLPLTQAAVRALWQRP